MVTARTPEQRAAKAAYAREWYARNREKVIAWSARTKARNPDLHRRLNRESAARVRASDIPAALEKERRWRERNPTAYLLTHAKARAKKLGVAFDLGPEDVAIPEVCPALGIPLFWGTGRRASQNHNSPSLDRLDPKKGYVRGNVRVVSNRANHLKNNGTSAELRLIADYIDREMGF